MDNKLIIQNYQTFLKTVNPKLVKTFDVAISILDDPNTQLVQIAYGSIDKTPMVLISYTNNNVPRTLGIKETSIDIFNAKTKARIRHISFDHDNMTYNDVKTLSEFKPS